MIRFIRALAAVTLALAAGIPLGGTATAGTVDALCTGTQDVTYSPGLTLAPTTQDATAHNIYIACVSSRVHSGERIGTNHQVLSCLDLAESSSGSTTITWNTGDTSLFTFNRTVTHAGGNTIVTFTGIIAAGLFAGDGALEVVTGPDLNLLDCLTPPGVTHRAGVTELTITHL